MIGLERWIGLGRAADRRWNVRFHRSREGLDRRLLDLQRAASRAHRVYLARQRSAVAHATLGGVAL